MTGQKKKKRKFEKISLDWGTGTDEEDHRALERKMTRDQRPEISWKSSHSTWERAARD